MKRKILNLRKNLLRIETVFVIASCAATYFLSRYYRKKLSDAEMADNGFKEYYETVSRWVTLVNKGYHASDYFEHNHFRVIGIYGGGALGEMLYSELLGSGIKVAYVTDRTKKEMEYIKDAKLIHPGFIEQEEKVDAIIITPIHFKQEILDQLCAMNLSDDTKFIMFSEIVNYFSMRDLKKDVMQESKVR